MSTEHTSEKGEVIPGESSKQWEEHTQKFEEECPHEWNRQQSP